MAGKAYSTQADTERSRSPIPWVLAAFLLFGATLAMRFPGVVMFDSVTQYEQATTGIYTDWHPPIMARTWALLNHYGSGTGPLFVIQMLLWWGGLGLLATAVGRRQRHGAAALVLLVGIAPLWLGWATVVLKDAQMACCLVAATGLAAYWRLDGRKLPQGAVVAIGLLLVYATLVRANAAFATVPFALALFDWRNLRRQWPMAGATVASIGAVIIVAPALNRYLFRAEHTGVENALPLYDMAGIAHRAHLATLPGLASAGWALAEKRGCYTPYFWNPYGEDSECGFVGDTVIFDHLDDRRMISEWVALVARHPLAYAEHRLAHLNSNLRFWVSAGEPDAAPPLESEPNRYGLGAPAGPAAGALIAAATMMAASPLGWPVIWLVVAAGLLWASQRRIEPQARLGRALAFSAVFMSASFIVVSIASDLRYHLWSMVAAALALILLIDARALDRRRSMISGGIVLMVVVIATAGRLGLAAPVYVPMPHPMQPAGAPSAHQR